MRVWMAISAIWVAFWLSMAALIAMAAEMTVPLDGKLGLFALIVLTPPLALLAVGSVLRWGFEIALPEASDRLPLNALSDLVCFSAPLALDVLLLALQSRPTIMISAV